MSNANAQSETIIRVQNLHRIFRMGDATIPVLRGVDLAVKRGEFLAIEGRSGSGKSTLLHIMGALDEPSDGAVDFNDRSLFKLSATERSRIRNERFGFVFQFYHLLPELNVLENTLLAAMVKYSYLGFKSNRTALRKRATDLLAVFGLSERLHHRPSQLSGGERQRVAIARALMNEPQVLFADEPTGNLDEETGRQIMKVIEDLHARGQTIVMVTHDRSLARRADRVLVLHKGHLQKSE